jgi:hypothetical protein
MNTAVKHLEESQVQQPASNRAFWRLLILGAIALVSIALSNPSEQRHRAAIGDKTHCQYHNYLLFSTISTIELDGEYRQLSFGFLGTVQLTESNRS